MTTLKITKQNGMIETVKVSGHALYADHGDDIVCAAISSFTLMTLNNISAFKMDNSIDSKVSEGNVDVKVKDLSNDTVQLLINTYIAHMRQLEEKYPKHIKIEEE